MSDAGGAAREPDPTLGNPVATDQGARAAGADEVRDVDEVVEDLRRQLAAKEATEAEKDAQLARERADREAEQRARQQAEQRAVAAEQARRQAERTGQREAEQARVETITTELDSHKAQMDALKAQHASLQAEGEFIKAADIQAQMALLGARIVSREEALAALKERVKQPPDREPDDQQQQRAVDQQATREAFIARQPPTVQAWLRSSNGEKYFTDEAFQRRVIDAARYAANVKAIDVASPQYIEFIEESLGLRQAQQPPPRQDDDRTGETRGRDADAGDRRMVAAPAGGATGGSVRSNSSGQTEVYLTREEREMADRQGLTHAEYARHKADLMREGLIGPGARSR